MGSGNLEKEYQYFLPLAKQVMEAVSMDLSKLLSENGVQIHSMRYRVKEYDSFQAKVALKKYDSPFSDCTDIVGIRVICLFKDQLDVVAKLIKKNETVIEEIDKGADSVDTFAYASKHLVLTRKTTKGVVAVEIQIRTILQDAWAEIEHYVNYKNFGADTSTVRQINSIAALFEIADNQFQQVHQEFLKLTKKPVAVTKELSGILLLNYCKNRYPWAFDGAFSDVNDLFRFEALATKFKEKRIKNIRELNEILDEHEAELMKDDAFRVKEIKNNPSGWPQIYDRVKKSGHFYSPVVLLGMLVNSI